MYIYLTIVLRVSPSPELGLAHDGGIVVGIDRRHFKRGRDARLSEKMSFQVRVKGALCASVIRPRVSYNQNHDTLSRNSLRYLS